MPHRLRLTIRPRERNFPSKRQAVSIIRTILVALIALSVAVLPAAGGMMPAAKQGGTLRSEQASSAAMPVDCQHSVPVRDHGSKPLNDCAGMASCAVNCFSYAGTTVPVIALAPTCSTPHPIIEAGVAMSKIGSPPFRPPRV